MTLRIAIAGAGVMALTAAAQLAARGHEAVIWSPRGRRFADVTGGTLPFSSRGALVGAWTTRVAETPDALLRDVDGILIAVDAAGFMPVMDALAPFIEPRHVVMVGAALSLGGLYLERLLAARGGGATILSWSTTLGTAGRLDDTTVDIRTIRPKIRASVSPATRREDAPAFCAAAFGEGRFDYEPSAIAIALLANSNPVFHVPAMLLNVSRIEQGETWAPYGQTTAAVGRLMEALDAERCAVGAALGFQIHSVNAHFHRSFKTPLASMAVMNAALHAEGRGPAGPRSTIHRYIAQDIPYGLVVTEELGRRAGIATPVHTATITLAAASLGTDYRAANQLLPELDLDSMITGRDHDALASLPASKGGP